VSPENCEVGADDGFAENSILIASRGNKSRYNTVILISAEEILIFMEN
jgi:hypothetical protein